MRPTGPDAASLSRIAEAAMRELRFEPEAPAAALRQASEAPEAPPPDAEVRDLRQLPWTSIDNPESRDLDQIEAIEAVGGGTRLYVGIADVDAYVPRGSAIDRFAHTNTTSVYTGVRTFPMLPDRLSFDVTSLLAGKPRLAVVYETEIGKDGAVGKVKTYRALVENRAKLDYPSVSAWLDGAGPEPRGLTSRELEAQLRGQDDLARVLGEARKRAGAIDVDTEQTRPVMEDGRVTALVPAKQTRAGRIIEELMVASNYAVACALDAAGVPSIRRVVKAPERWAKIVAYAGERGVVLPGAPSSVALAGFIEAMRRERPADFADISLSIVKLMGRGEYVAHAPGSREIGHFGLATTQYTHSTAPNRRYVDLVIQRLVKGGKGKGGPYALPELSQIAEHASERESAAQKVERRVQKSAAASLLQPRVGQRFEGIVTGAADKGTFVRIFDPHAEGKIVEGARGLRVGDRVTVRLLDTNVERGFIDFGV